MPPLAAAPRKKIQTACLSPTLAPNITTHPIRLDISSSPSSLLARHRSQTIIANMTDIADATPAVNGASPFGKNSMVRSFFSPLGGPLTCCLELTQHTVFFACDALDRVAETTNTWPLDASGSVKPANGMFYTPNRLFFVSFALVKLPVADMLALRRAPYRPQVPRRPAHDTLPLRLH